MCHDMDCITRWLEELRQLVLECEPFIPQTVEIESLGLCEALLLTIVRYPFVAIEEIHSFF